MGDHVYLYLPRLAHVKLAVKWNGPFRVIKTAHPIYTVSIPITKGPVSKTVTLDKLKREGNDLLLVEINIDSEENKDSRIEPSTLPEEHLEENSDEDETIPRYKLRPRRNIVKYNRERVSFVAAFR